MTNNARVIQNTSLDDLLDELQDAARQIAICPRYERKDWEQERNEVKAKIQQLVAQAASTECVVQRPEVIDLLRALFDHITTGSSMWASVHDPGTVKILRDVRMVLDPGWTPYEGWGKAWGTSVRAEEVLAERRPPDYSQPKWLELNRVICAVYSDNVAERLSSLSAAAYDDIKKVIRLHGTEVGFIALISGALHHAATYATNAAKAETPFAGRSSEDGKMTYARVIPVVGMVGNCELREKPGEKFAFYREGDEMRVLSEFEDEFVRSAIAYSTSPNTGFAARLLERVDAMIAAREAIYKATDWRGESSAENALIAIINDLREMSRSTNGDAIRAGSVSAERSQEEKHG